MGIGVTGNTRVALCTKVRVLYSQLNTETMKTNKQMEIANAVVKIVLLVIMKIVFIIPNIIIYLIKSIESALRVTHKTLTFLMKNIEDEILK